MDEAVDALIDCAQAYLSDSAVVFMLVTSLMKLAVSEMTTRHPQIKDFMLRVEASPNYQTHKAGEEFIRNAKYGRALAEADQLVPDHMPFLAAYAHAHLSSPTRRKYLISKTNTSHYELLEQEQERQELDEALGLVRNQSYPQPYLATSSTSNAAPTTAKRTPTRPSPTSKTPSTKSQPWPKRRHSLCWGRGRGRRASRWMRPSRSWRASSSAGKRRDPSILSVSTPLRSRCSSPSGHLQSSSTATTAYNHNQEVSIANRSPLRHFKLQIMVLPPSAIAHQS